MGPQITYGILADGGTDRVLSPIISWAIRRLHPEVEILEPEFTKKHGSISDALGDYPVGPMLIFVHRDAEGMGHDTRLEEFDQIDDDRVVPVIPVRMTEAWLLIDAQAIALAAGRPHANVSLPKVSRLEELHNPKAHLEDLLLEAAGNPTGRRRKRFQRRMTTCRVDVASRIADFSALMEISSFAKFVDRLAERYPYR